MSGNPNSALETDDLSITVPGRMLVDRCSCAFAAGEFVALLGGNGTGKSLLLRTLAGLRPPARGSVRLRGSPLPSLARRDIAARLGFLPQDPDAAPQGVLAESVLLGRFAHLGLLETPGKDDDARVGAALAHVGLAAPVTLIFARLLQGFSVGGEYGTSATYMSEVTPAHQRGFYSGILYVTLVMGQLLSLAVLLVLQWVFLTHDQLEAWGWRIPFAIGAVAALGGLYLRRNLPESQTFQKHRESGGRSGEVRLLLQHPREVAIVIGLTAGGTLYFYIFTTYIQQFLANTVGLSKTDATTVSSASLFLFMLMQPVMGALSDRIGRRPMLITFGVLALLTTVPLLSTLAQAHSAWMAFVLVTLALAISSFYSSISAVVKAELFPVEIRALGVGLPYAVAVSLFGGTAPFIGLWFKSIGHESWFYWYVTVCVLGSLLVYIFMREPQRTSRI